MTNYEWLVETNKINSFMNDVHEKIWSVVHEIYGIPNDTRTSDWLQEEHIYDYKYVIKTETRFDTSEERYQIHCIEYSDDVAQLFNDTIFYDTLDEARAMLIKIIEEKIRTNV